MKYLFKFYTKNLFYIALFFVATFVTAFPWTYSANDVGIWVMRIFFLLAYAMLNVTGYFIAKNNDKPKG